MRHIALKDLTDKQRQAWAMRYYFGWRMSKIAIELGLKTPAVCRLLHRAELRAGLPRVRNVRIIRTQPRNIRVVSLSDVYNY